MARQYSHVWGQGTVDPSRKDLAALKLRYCLGSTRLRGNVLEVGCGAGRFIRTLKHLNPSLRCYGCDLDESSIRLARSYDDGVDYKVADAISLPYKDDFFDTIVLFDIMEHVPDTDAFIDELLRVAKPDASFHMYVPCEGEPLTVNWVLSRIRIGHRLKRKHAGHVQSFRKKELRALLGQKGLLVKEIRYSTYLLGQIVDIMYYALQEIPAVKKKLQQAHATKDEKQRQGIISSIAKTAINLAFLLSYLESILIRRSLLAQGMHITCRIKKQASSS